MSLETEKLEKQLKVVGVLFMAASGLCLLGLLFIPIHYMMMQSVMKIDFPHQGEVPNPREIFEQMRGTLPLMYGIMGGMLLIFGGVMLATGINLYRKKHQTFCIVGSAMSCLCMPWGTALGIWSLLILFDKQVQPLFQEQTELNESDFLS
ncbi:hypothetical protein [Gimesia fumaroli]|uniref:DUF4064 domain-containing protein n=1 Tax=Gimesia fumaroli TaxID=2527976 RepID=A0A518IA23_9PLAN|nr:hypothetical protein [Gimesia fumaroli]QDV49934.1 hypothetical protein Enr17x_19560 [Gimesia fumaroli]